MLGLIFRKVTETVVASLPAPVQAGLQQATRRSRSPSIILFFRQFLDHRGNQWRLEGCSAMLIASARPILILQSMRL